MEMAQTCVQLRALVTQLFYGIVLVNVRKVAKHELQGK
jgi:hypothetical protein